MTALPKNARVPRAFLHGSDSAFADMDDITLFSAKINYIIFYFSTHNIKTVVFLSLKI